MDFSRVEFELLEQGFRGGEEEVGMEIAKMPFTFAFNDQPGAWTVTARDVVSGIAVSQKFKVR